MHALKAHVRNGQFVLEQPTSLRDGTEVKLEVYVCDPHGDDLSDEERHALHAALDDADEDIANGRTVSEEDVWAALRAIK